MEIKMSKWIKIEKSTWGLSGSIVFFNAICLYAGRTDHWGIAAAINFYDRSISFEIFNLFVGVEVWHKQAGDE
jgi:hypothetical protein